MSLNIKLGWRRIIKWSLWAIVGVLLLIFLIRVISYENYYYNSMEGSERDIAGDIGAISTDEELIEEKPEDSDVREYTVPADRPRYLTIERLGIRNARVLAMGVNKKGELDTPRNIFDVGWYEKSGKPGQGGTLVIDGHNGGPHVHGVFKDLPVLSNGDTIQVERGDGAVYKYSVVENKSIPLAEADSYMSIAFKSPVKGEESITLISCTGEWSQKRGTYLSRQFTRAILVEV